MGRVRIIWDDEENPDGNVQRIAQHGLTMDDIEYVLENSIKEARSRSTNRPCCFGYTAGGDYIIVIYEQVDDDTLYPVTAFEAPEP